MPYRRKKSYRSLHPGGVHWTCSVPALAANDHPADINQLDLADVLKQRLYRKEGTSRRVSGPMKEVLSTPASLCAGGLPEPSAAVDGPRRAVRRRRARVKAQGFKRPRRPRLTRGLALTAGAQSTRNCHPDPAEHAGAFAYAELYSSAFTDGPGNACPQWIAFNLPPAALVLLQRKSQTVGVTVCSLPRDRLGDDDGSQLYEDGRHPRT